VATLFTAGTIAWSLVNNHEKMCINSTLNNATTSPVNTYTVSLDI
jgi:hypothetical protein